MLSGRGAANLQFQLHTRKALLVLCALVEAQASSPCHGGVEEGAFASRSCVLRTAVSQVEQVHVAPAAMG